MFKRLVDALDNELQHHRMFPRFVALGCSECEFYDHGEKNTVAYLGEVVQTPPDSLLKIIPDYLTLLAPGGDLSPADRLSLDARFLNIRGGKWRQAFATIRAAIDAWSGSPSLSAETTVRAICQTMHDPCLMWFGYREKDRPPNDGFFAGPPFDVDEQSE